jgi:nucleoid-associated protein
MIAVKKLVVHEIRKEQDTKIAISDLSNALIPVIIGEEAYSMVEELEKRYSLLSQTYAIFDEDTTTPSKQFPIQLKEYIDNGNTDEGFLDFSVKTINTLKDIIEPIFKAKGGYLIFVEYVSKVKFVAIFFVRNRKGRFLSKDKATNTFKINESIYIDVDHLAMAGRINLNLLESEMRYLSFINKRNEETKFFLRWMCATDRLSNKDDTKIFREILNEIDLPDGTDDKTLFIKNILNHIKTSESKNVDLRTIGTVFYNNGEKLISFIEENDKIINHEFKPDAQELKKLVVLRASADRITLDFPLSYLKDGRIDVNESENKIIITSPLLLEKIKSEKTFFDTTIND